jgi:hypothetical protein
LPAIWTVQISGSNTRAVNRGTFTFRLQPDTSWINEFGRKGLLSTDPLVSDMIPEIQSAPNITAQISLICDLNIDVNFDKTFDKQYSELFKDTLAPVIPVN